LCIRVPPIDEKIDDPPACEDIQEVEELARRYGIILKNWLQSRPHTLSEIGVKVIEENLDDRLKILLPRVLMNIPGIRLFDASMMRNPPASTVCFSTGSKASQKEPCRFQGALFWVEP